MRIAVVRIVRVPVLNDVARLTISQDVLHGLEGRVHVETGCAVVARNRRRDRVTVFGECVGVEMEDFLQLFRDQRVDDVELWVERETNFPDLTGRRGHDVLGPLFADTQETVLDRQAPLCVHELGENLVPFGDCPVNQHEDSRRTWRSSVDQWHTP